MSDIISSQSDAIQLLSLRERKKQLVQTTIAETALRLFQQQGYEQTSIQDIAEAVMMSTRTFFRHFASKEEVLFGPTKATLTEGVHFLQHAAPIETPRTALKATLEYMANRYQQQRESFLIRYRVAVQTPSIASFYVYALLEGETTMSHALYTRLENTANQEEIDALVAIYMAAFRLALIAWLEHEAQQDLLSLLRKQLDIFSSLFRHI
ncbi:TetR family transcriptional regulator [Dictyobacter sp. S3.2.2.5]|uniref:TetR family transcriptional regulator n=1 Tax=Dictyobacter halimunensis TaxID=3026934 RepID=A0ABQ6G7P1_9CHLR|nr:TetR family transcriptional regulator [Dictyobacter sp. S3.2.2.5]